MSLICSKCGRDLNEIWQDNMSPVPGLVLCEDCSGFTARSKFERQCWAEYDRYLSQEFEAYIKEANEREKLERGKGCRYCQDKSYKQKGYYVDDPEGEIVGINHYCMNCGKRLEVEP